MSANSEKYIFPIPDNLKSTVEEIGIELSSLYIKQPKGIWHRFVLSPDPKYIAKELEDIKSLSKEAVGFLTNYIFEHWSDIIKLIPAEHDSDKDKDVIIKELEKHVKHWFIDAEDNSKAWAFTCSDKPECLCMTSGWNLRFKQFVRKIAYEVNGVAIKKDLLEDIVNTVESKTLFSKDIKRIKVWLRCAAIDNIILYDLCNADGQMVKVTANNVCIVNVDVPIFQRHSHMKEVKIDLTSDADALDELMKLLGITGDLVLLLKVYIVSTFIPNIQHPIILIVGSAGSGKTTLAVLIRVTVDDTTKKPHSLTRDEKEFARICYQNYFLIWDNVSYLNDDLADTLCRAVTGATLDKRKLYTDMDSIEVSYIRCMAMTAIAPPTNREDFIDRCLLSNMKYITLDLRRSEEELKAAVEKLQPSLLAQCMRTLSKAMKLKPAIKLKKLPRLADWCIWGEAISQALGNAPEVFLTTYLKHLDEISQEVLESAGDMQAVIEYYEKLFNEQKVAELKIEPADLFDKITTNLQVDSKGKVKFPYGWAKSPIGISKHLRKYQTTLLRLGYRVTFGTESPNKRRVIVIIKQDTLDNTPKQDEDSRQDGANGADGAVSVENFPAKTQVNHEEAGTKSLEKEHGIGGKFTTTTAPTAPTALKKRCTRTAGTEPYKPEGMDESTQEARQKFICRQHKFETDDRAAWEKHLAEQEHPKESS